MKRVTPPPRIAPLQASATEIRDYWRGRIVNNILVHSSAFGLLPPFERDFRKLPPHVYELVVRKSQELLDWACGYEPLNGRTQSMEHHVRRELSDLIKQYQPTPAGLMPQQAPLQLEIGSDDS